MEVESLEREESMISTKEGFILNRLRAVEKSSEDIIKVRAHTHTHRELSPPASFKTQNSSCTLVLQCQKIKNV